MPTLVTPEKKWYLSKGVLGGLVSLAVMIFGLFNLPAVGEAIQSEAGAIAAIVASVVGIISSITAVIGRVKANSKITK